MTAEFVFHRLFHNTTNTKLLVTLSQNPKTINYLTDCPLVRQTKAKMAKSRKLVKPGWVYQLIGRIDHAKYFWPGTTLVAVAAHPNFQFTNKNYLFYAKTNSKILHTIWVLGLFANFLQILRTAHPTQPLKNQLDLLKFGPTSLKLKICH